MWNFLGGLLSGGSSLIGGIINNRQSAANTQQTNMANYMMGLQNQAFQSQQRSTAYQTAVADMKAAGLNPAMMYGGSGGPAPMATGGFAPSQTAHVENAVAPAIDRVVMALRLANETAYNDALVQKTTQETATSAAQARLVNADAATRELAVPYVARQAAAQLRQTGGSARSLEAQSELTGAQTPGARAASEDRVRYGGSAIGNNAASAARMTVTAADVADAFRTEQASIASAKAFNEAQSWLLRRDSGSGARFAPRHISPPKGGWSSPGAWMND